MTLLALLTMGGCAEVSGFFEDLAGSAEDVKDDVEDVKDDVEDAQDELEGLTNPLVTQALLLDFTPPDFEGIDPSTIDGFDIAPFATVILADATEVADLENAPIMGAEPKIKTPGQDQVLMDDQEDGTYYADGSYGLVYKPGEEAKLTIRMDGIAHTAVVQMPRQPDDLDVPLLHTANDNMVVDFADYSFHQILVVVVDAETQEITYSNEPETAQELYDFSQDRDVKARFDIPSRAFNRETYYAVGIAGVLLSSDDDLVEMNTALSAFMAGKFYFYPVSTVPLGE